MKRWMIAVLLALSAFVRAQDMLHESRSDHNARMKWWREARFGLFLHWGLYSVPAGAWNGRTDHGEWIRHSAEIPLEEYDKFVGQFNPVRFDARAWVRMAKQAGMQYIVITSKHHDGFCLFDSHETDFDVMSTPFHRDVLKELSEACRAEGMTLCFYYSIMDWHHPDYLPRRPWEEKDRPAGGNFDRYVRYMKNELKELLTNYGPIGVLWFDGEWESTWNETRGVDLYNYVRSLQPSIIINNRVGAGRSGMAGITKEGEFGGDFGTPEQEVPSTGLPGVDWETCMTMNDNWGYNKNDHHWKSAAELIQTLADIASKGGNFLLNVGPTSEGLFPDTSAERLREIGEWMRVNGESIHGTTASPFKHLEWGRCTQRPIEGGTRLYLHVFDWPENGLLTIPGLLSDPKQAFLLGSQGDRTLNFARSEDAIVVGVSGTTPNPYNTVLVLDVKGPVHVANPPEISADHSIFIDSLEVDATASLFDAELRYTTDGSSPTKASPRVQGRIRIDVSCTVSVRQFEHDRPVSSTSRRKFTKVRPLPKSDVDAVTPGIQFKYYEGEWNDVPDFPRLKSVKAGVIPFISFSLRLQEEKFGFVYTGFIRVPDDDVYTFFVNSDDGSRLLIGDSLIVENGGLHSMLEKSGAVALAAGLHPFRLEYFERTGGDGLQVSIQSRRIPKQEIPNSMLFH